MFEVRRGSCILGRWSVGEEVCLLLFVKERKELYDEAMRSSARRQTGICYMHAFQPVHSTCSFQMHSGVTCAYTLNSSVWMHGVLYLPVQLWREEAIFVVKLGVCVAVGTHSHVLSLQRVQTCNRISGFI